MRLRENQYGGEPGVSTTHMLIDVWTKINSDLEDNRAASVITAVDYSKAFNRLEHLPCLLALQRKGAGSGLLRIIASFLHERHMTVRVGEARSDLRKVNAGAPQGPCRGPCLGRFYSMSEQTIWTRASRAARRWPNVSLKWYLNPPRLPPPPSGQNNSPCYTASHLQ